MIVVEDFSKSVKITGYPEQIAMEFEDAARVVREALCARLGKDKGNVFFEFIIVNSRKNKSEADADAVEIRHRLEAEDPELVKMFDSSPVMDELIASYIK